MMTDFLNEVGITEVAPSKHVNVGPTWVSHGLQGYRVGMGSKWASYLGPTWVTQLGPTWVNPGGHLIWGPLG